MTSLPTATSENRSTPARSWTRFFPIIARLFLGLPLLVFGLNGFFSFIPTPQLELPEKALTFLTALEESGYLLPLISGTLLTVGLLLVINRFVPLALVLFAPFLVNSLAFHFALEPSGRGPALVYLVLELYLAWVYRAAYRPLLRARSEPSILTAAG